MLRCLLYEKIYCKISVKKKPTLDIDIKTTNVKSKNQKEKRLPISFSLIHKPTANCDLASKQSL